MTNELPNDLVTIREAAEKLGRPITSIHNWINTGKLATFDPKPRRISLAATRLLAEQDSRTRSIRNTLKRFTNGALSELEAAEKLLDRPVSHEEWKAIKYHLLNLSLVTETEAA